MYKRQLFFQCADSQRKTLNEPVIAEISKCNYFLPLSDRRHGINNPVSYTHLDVYKRQALHSITAIAPIVSAKVKVCAEAIGN